MIIVENKEMGVQHIRITFLVVREMMENKEMGIQHISIKEMKGGPLTKGFFRN